MRLTGKWLWGQEISPYGQEMGYLDYGTLAKVVNHVLANDLMAKTEGLLGYWEPMGECDDEVFQWYIVDESGADLLLECGEQVWRNEVLDLYLWGVTHWGTAWDYVLTNVRCNTGEVDE